MKREPVPSRSTCTVWKPVAGKRAVPKERISLQKDVHEEAREVGDTVRKERIDVDDATGR